MAKTEAYWAGRYALLLAQHNLLRIEYDRVCRAMAKTQRQIELPLACSCGCTDPPVTDDYGDYGGWPYCPQCKGV